MAQKKRHHYLTNKVIYLMLFALGCSEVRFSVNDSSVAKNEGCDFWGRFVQVGQTAPGFAQFVSDNCSSEKTTLTCTQAGFSPPVGQLKPYCVKEKCEGADPVIGKFVAFYADTENSGDPRVPTNVDINLLSQTNRDPRLECKNIPIQDLVWSESMPLVGKSNKGCLCTQSKDCLLTEIFNTSTLKCEQGPTLTPTATSTPTGNPNRSTITPTPTPSATGAPTRTPTPTQTGIPTSTPTMTPTATPTITSTPTLPPIQCPTNYIPVNAIAPYTNVAFCVAAFEARKEGSDSSVQAVSKPIPTPWIFASKNDAKLGCSNNGVKYALITNAEWQTVARTIERQSANWYQRKLGQTSINRGHSDAAPNGILSVANLSDDYDQTMNNENEPINSSTLGFGGWEQKRSHILPNGKVWDFAGNAPEWVSDDSQPFSVPNSYDDNFAMARVGEISQVAKDLYGPEGDYRGLAVPNTEFGGLGFCRYGSISMVVPSSPILRGGGGLHRSASGIFHTNLTSIPPNDRDLTGLGNGFRCVYHP